MIEPEWYIDTYETRRDPKGREYPNLTQAC